MLTTVFAKTIRDRWIGMTVASVIVGLFMLVAMPAYREIDLGVYTNLPEAIRSLMGIPEGADVASLAYSIIFGMLAALTLAGLAVSMGSAAVAREERDGTMGLLLGNPKSRTHVLLSKMGSMLVLIGLGVVVVWGASLATPALLDIEIGATHLAAASLHLAVNALFWGFLALAIGAWTGKGGLSSGIAAGLMVLSYFAVGLLPLVDGLANAVKAVPWYYYDGSKPLNNGIDWAHLAVLGAGIVVFGIVSVLGVNRRDLRESNGGVTIVDRLRTNPKTRRVFERLAGSARVSRIWVKTASEHQVLLIVVVYVMFLVMGVLMGPMYTAIDDTLAGLGDDLPEALMAIAGGGDMSTPEGWYQVESFGLMVPIAVIVVTAVIGARALAGEEEHRTMGLLLANPIPRSKVVLQKMVAMVVYAFSVGVAVFAGVALGSVISSLGMDMGNIAAASLLGTLLGLVFGSLALAISAATGRVRVAIYGTVGVALASHLFNSFLALNESTAGYAKLTPHYYYLGNDPLVNGMHWGHGAVLAALTVILVGLAVVLFERRDIRQS